MRGRARGRTLRPWACSERYSPFTSPRERFHSWCSGSLWSRRRSNDRRVGWVYVVAAAAVAATGLLSCIPLVSTGRPLRWGAGIFLAYVSVLAGASAQFGVRALRTKGRAGPSRDAIDLVPPLVLIAGGVALAAFGVHRSTVLYVLFASLGVVLGVAHLRFWLTPPAHDRAGFCAVMNGRAPLASPPSPRLCSS